MNTDTLTLIPLQSSSNPIDRLMHAIDHTMTVFYKSSCRGTSRFVQVQPLRKWYTYDTD